jgi:hypothetical protein
MIKYNIVILMLKKSPREAWQILDSLYEFTNGDLLRLFAIAIATSAEMTNLCVFASLVEIY